MKRGRGDNEGDLQSEQSWNRPETKIVNDGAATNGHAVDPHTAVALCEPASRRMMAIPPLSLQDAAADAFFRVAGPNDREGARKLLDKLNVGASSLQTALRFLEGLVSVLLSSVRQDPKLLQLQQLRNCVVLQLESYIEAIQTIRPALKTARDDLIFDFRGQVFLETC